MSEKGTWAWACEQMLEGMAVKRSRSAALRLDSATDLLEVRTGRGWTLMTNISDCSINRQDFESADWEVVSD